MIHRIFRGDWLALQADIVSVQSLKKEAIGFGSINLYYQCPPDDIQLGYKAVKQEIPQRINGIDAFLLQEPIHATAPRNP